MKHISPQSLESGQGHSMGGGAQSTDHRALAQGKMWPLHNYVIAVPNHHKGGLSSLTYHSARCQAKQTGLSFSVWKPLAPDMLVVPEWWWPRCCSSTSLLCCLPGLAQPPDQQRRSPRWIKSHGFIVHFFSVQPLSIHPTCSNTLLIGVVG